MPSQNRVGIDIQANVVGKEAVQQLAAELQRLVSIINAAGGRATTGGYQQILSGAYGGLAPQAQAQMYQQAVSQARQQAEGMNIRAAAGSPTAGASPVVTPPAASYANYPRPMLPGGGYAPQMALPTPYWGVPVDSPYVPPTAAGPGARPMLPPSMMALPPIGGASSPRHWYGYSEPAPLGTPALPPIGGSSYRPPNNDTSFLGGLGGRAVSGLKGIIETAARNASTPFSGHMLYGLLFQAFFGTLFGGLQQYVQSHTTGERMPQGAMAPMIANIIGIGTGLVAGGPYGAMVGGMIGQLGGQVYSGQAEGKYLLNAAIGRSAALYTTDSFGFGNYKSLREAAIGYGGAAGLDVGKWWLPNYGTGARMVQLAATLGGPMRMYHGGSYNGVDNGYTFPEMLQYAVQVQRNFGDQSGNAADRIAKYLSNPLLAYGFMPDGRGAMPYSSTNGYLSDTLATAGINGIVGSLNSGSGSRNFSASTAIGLYLAGGDTAFTDYLSMHRQRGGQTDALMQAISSIWRSQGIMQVAGLNAKNLAIYGGAISGMGSLLGDPGMYGVGINSAISGLTGQVGATNNMINMFAPYAKDPNVAMLIRSLQGQVAQGNLGIAQAQLSLANTPLPMGMQTRLQGLETEGALMGLTMSRSGSMRKNLRAIYSALGDQIRFLESERDSAISGLSPGLSESAKYQWNERISGLQIRQAQIQNQLESGWQEKLVSTMWGMPGRATGIMHSFNYMGASRAYERGGFVFDRRLGGFNPPALVPSLSGESDSSTGRGGMVAEALGGGITVHIHVDKAVLDTNSVSQLKRELETSVRNWTSATVPGS